MSERERGCGYRKIGGLYLTGDPGLTLICDGLPLPLEPCGCCGFEPPFSRNLQRIQGEYISQAENRKHNREFVTWEDYKRKGFDETIKCSCPPNCPICSTMKGFLEPGIFGLMFVGKKYYTPQSFIREAETMGICKRIPDIPKWLRLGETWVLLAHSEVPKVTLEQLQTNGMHMKEPEKMKAIFYAFKPQRIEMPVWKGEITDTEILTLESKGITVILLDPTPENKKRHGKAKNIQTLMRLLKPDEEETE
jgi:hypothetical protein